VNSARLAIDLGTSHTVGVVLRPGQPVRALVFDGSPLLPSGVAAAIDGTLLTGRDAERMAQSAPERFEPHPKRRVDEGAVLLGERVVDVPDLLAAILRRVAVEAGPAAAATVLTCPADWGGPRRDVLREAARRAGLGGVRLVDEPVAAAAYCMGMTGQQLYPGQALAVFDFGGGTLDVTVVRRDPDRLRVLATGGLDDLGGLDVDAALVGHLGQLLELRDPHIWHRLRAPRDPAQARERRLFWSETRAAKEMLSRASTAPVHVPGRPEALHLTREELERVAGPLIARAVDETRRVVERAGVAPGTLAGILLVGGSSRIPLVASRLHARFGVAPTMPEQPELPVAHGALLVAEPPASPTHPPPATHTPPRPLTAAAPRPVSAAAVVPPYSVKSPTAKRKRRGRRVAAAVGGSALVVVLLLVLGTVSAVRELLNSLTDGASGTGLLGDRGSTAGSLTRVHDVAITPGGAAVAADGENAYYAVSGADKTTVSALPLAGGAARWKTTVAFGSGDLRLTRVGALLVVDGKQTTMDGDARAVVDTVTGKALWAKQWKERNDLAYVGTDVLVETLDQPTSMSRVDLRTGKARWRVPGPDTLFVIDARFAKAARAWTTAPRKIGDPLAPPAGNGFRESVIAGTDVVLLDEQNKRGRVVDGRTGKVRRSAPLPLEDELWTVYDGMVVGAEHDTGGATVIAGHRLSDLGQAWEFSLVAGSSVEAVRPCGPKRICVVADGPSGDTAVHAVDLVKGAEVWRHAAPDDMIDVGLYVVGGRLIFGEDSFGDIGEPVLLDVDNKELRAYDEQGVAFLGADGDRAAMQGVRLAGTEVVFQVAVANLGSGKATEGVDAGAEPPAGVAMVGDTLVILTAGDAPRVRVYRVALT
jgi:actin-like ATPase involved in cell morphogenesis